MKSVPTLHTDRCILSAVTQSDIHVLCQILDDTVTQRFLPELCEEFQTAESLQQFFASFDKYLLQNEGLLWGIRKDNLFVGFIAIMDISSNSTMFYAMHPEYRNNGYMKECLVKVLDFVKDNILCQKLKTEVYLDNNISRKLLNDIGFVSCGSNKKKEYFYRWILI